jgi:two-component system, OmpR family, phosphate regulon sensor histidine kinase PhoR
MRRTASSMPYGYTARMEGRPNLVVDDGQSAPDRLTEFETVLLAIAGHDLRQPLQAIQSVHDLLSGGERTESEQRVLNHGQTAIDGLRDQLDQLLNALRPLPAGSES